MELQQNKFEKEFADGTEFQDQELISYLQAEFDYANSIKKQRKTVVEANLNEFRKIGAYAQNSKGIIDPSILNNNSKNFTDPVLATIISAMIASDWVPDITFEPEQYATDPNDKYDARNGTRIHNFMLDKGGFYEQAGEAGYDLFAKGTAYFMKGFRLRDKKTAHGSYLMPDYIQYRNWKWEHVYHTQHGDSWFMIDPYYTKDRLLRDFGESIFKQPIKYGNPFESGETEDVDWNNRGETKDRYIGVAYFYNGIRKQMVVVIGGGKHVQGKHMGSAYPEAFTDETGQGFVPVDYINASKIKHDGINPICTLDRVVDAWNSYNEMVNVNLERARRHSDPQTYIKSDDPEKAMINWLTMQAERSASGFADMPAFIQSKEKLEMQTIDWGVDNNNLEYWRNLFLETMTISEGVNFRMLGKGAETAEQERLRMQRELDVTREMIKNNQPHWKRFALTNMYCLKGVEAEFLYEHVDLEDEISDNEEWGMPAKGTIKEFMDRIDKFRFNTRTSINNSNSKRKHIEIEQKKEALQTIAPLFPESKAIQKMALELGKDIFPNGNFARDDFMPDPQAMAMAAGMGQPPQAPAMPQPAGLPVNTPMA